MKINKFKYKPHKLKRKKLFIFLVLNLGISLTAQEVNSEKQQTLEESKEFLSEASYEMRNDNFPLAEAAYREAIAINPEGDTGKYNLGTVYYDEKMNEAAMLRFKQAAVVADTKYDKHKAFHNLGNTFMNDKKYQEAVESYKNALRNNPKDEETRYNYALAKELLEEQEKKAGSDNQKEDQEDKKEKENKENQDNENNRKDGDDGDQKDQQDKGEQEQDKKDSNENQDKGKPNEPNDKKQQRQPTEPGKLSPQQVKNLLEAMNNEEKKVQEKINAKKQKGTKVKSEKDW
ncbi:MAG: tetratricopeptide repeat protein [Flavobacteriales bacterium]|nr:MAG: tetratricopeptide repeat protein [Flavobacteriales bacterium]